MENSASVNMYQYNEFYKKNHKSMYHFIFKRIFKGKANGDEQSLIAEELANDVFVKAYKAMHTFDEKKSQFKTWIYNIAINTIIDHLRKKKLETRSMHITAEDHDGDLYSEMDFASGDEDPLHSMITSESREKIKDAIAMLPPLQAEILSQFSVGYTYDEIADDLNMPLGTVKGALHNARVRMREIFKKNPVLA